MADSISFDMVTKPFTDWVEGQQKMMRRGAMYSLRETGRVVTREARAKAPVLSDKSAATWAQARRDMKARAAGHSGPVRGEGSSAPIRGLLRASISPAKRLIPNGLDSWTLYVGPRGWRVRLYAGKIEQLEPYMAPAREAAKAQATAIAAKTYTKIWKA